MWHLYAIRNGRITVVMDILDLIVGEVIRLSKSLANLTPARYGERSAGCQQNANECGRCKSICVASECSQHDHQKR
jgi:hypothetical protein